MEQNLEKLTKKELINKISKMSKKNIIKILNNQKGGSETEQSKTNISEVIIQPIIFNPLNMKNNKDKNKKNTMRNNKIYEGVTDYNI